MTDDNSNLVDMDLEAFSKTFYGNDEPVVTEPVKVEVEDEENEKVDETEDDALATEKTEPTDEGQEDETDEEPDEKPAKPVKKTAQDRINEVVAKQREAERERDALRQEVAALKAAPKTEVTKTDGPTPLREQLDANQPHPDALNEDGTPKYKLGEFDPMYIRDLTKHTIAEETAAAKEKQAAEDQRKTVEAAQAELQSSWLQKLEVVEQEIPDIREQIAGVETAFANIEPGYGEFLAATIMSCDNGPEIMAYLSQNIGEAQKIVASGPAAATLALGRLDAKFVKPAATGEKRNKKQSAAPEPAPAATRGSGGKFTVAPDTTDLAAFEREYYGKK